MLGIVVSLMWNSVSRLVVEALNTDLDLFFSLCSR
jgi:hypothetical protein